MLKNRTLLLVAISFFIISNTAKAGFVFGADHTPNGDVHYFSFGHWEAWENAGGYVEIVLVPQGGGETKRIRVSASQKIFYMEYNGTWTFYPKFADGSQAGVQFRQTIITNAKNYNGGFDRYQNLDPNNKDHWEGASPISNTPDFNKPNPTNPNPSDGGSNGGDNGNGDGGNDGDDGSGGDEGDGGGEDGGSGGDGGNGDNPPPPNPTPPSQPNPFTLPSEDLTVGDVVVSWGGSSDGVDNSVIGYRLEKSVDGGEWEHVSTENNTSRAVTLDKSGELKFRVRAEGSGGLNSPWQESDVFEVECGCWFEAPSWKQYMGKVDEIIDKIPPPPNWQQVADTFDNTIRPKLINDLENLLGEAPSPPATPPNLQINEPIRPANETIEDYASQLQEPVMEEVPGIDESGYTKEDIENEAPVIEFRDDPTGGFNIGNPLDSIPNVTSPPVPGQAASDWMEIPSEPQQQTPPVPSGGGNVNVPNPPTPNNNVGTPPVPGGNNSPAPTPDNNVPAPPTPEQNTPEPGNYKRHPEHADGSG